MAGNSTATSKAQELAARESGVTPSELRAVTGSKTTGAMAAVLWRLERQGTLHAVARRGGEPVFRDRLPENSRASGDGKRPTIAAKRRRLTPSTLAVAVKMARRPKGVTVLELKKKMNSKTIGPMAKSLKTGLEQAYLELKGSKRRGYDIYVSTGKSLPSVRKKKRGLSARSGERKTRSTTTRKRATRALPSKPEPPTSPAPVARRAKRARVKTAPAARATLLDNRDFLAALGRALEVFGQEIARSARGDDASC